MKEVEGREILTEKKRQIDKWMDRERERERRREAGGLKRGEKRLRKMES